MIGGDDVFDAAIERAGVVRAYSIAQLFSAARVLANNTNLKRFSTWSKQSSMVIRAILNPNDKRLIK
jgi:hypothetical protein